jgi:hypothetical protein
VPPAEAIKDNSGLYMYHGAACCKERDIKALREEKKK